MIESNIWKILLTWLTFLEQPQLYLQQQKCISGIFSIHIFYIKLTSYWIDVKERVVATCCSYSLVRMYRIWPPLCKAYFIHDEWWYSVITKSLAIISHTIGLVCQGTHRNGQDTVIIILLMIFHLSYLLLLLLYTSVIRHYLICSHGCSYLYTYSFTDVLLLKLISWV